MTSDVMNIDCLEYMRTLPDNAFQLAIADPPYGIGAASMTMGSGKNRQWTKKDWDTEIPMDEFFDELMRVSAEQIIWGGNYFPLPLNGNWIVWDKKNPNLSFAEGELAWCSIKRNLRIFQFYTGNVDNGGRIHPTQKPVALYAWLLKNYAKPGDRIFDPMMGSQSSRIAAYKMGFDYVGCELDKEYFAKGCERFDRECRGLYKSDNGKTYQQTSIFDPPQ